MLSGGDRTVTWLCDVGWLVIEESLEGYKPCTGMGKTRTGMDYGGLNELLSDLSRQEDQDPGDI